MRYRCREYSQRYSQAAALRPVNVPRCAARQVVTASAMEAVTAGVVASAGDAELEETGAVGPGRSVPGFPPWVPLPGMLVGRADDPASFSA